MNKKSPSSFYSSLLNAYSSFFSALLFIVFRSTLVTIVFLRIFPVLELSSEIFATTEFWWSCRLFKLGSIRLICFIFHSISYYRFRNSCVQELVHIWRSAPEVTIWSWHWLAFKAMKYSVPVSPVDAQNNQGLIRTDAACIKEIVHDKRSKSPANTHDLVLSSLRGFSV